jgi:hypothetical protein
VGNVEGSTEAASLGALAGAGWADQQHHRESSCAHLSPWVAQISAAEPRDHSSVPTRHAVGQ